MSNRKAHRGKRNPLTDSQRNQRQALKYYIRVTSFNDKKKREVIDVQPVESMQLTIKMPKGEKKLTGYGNNWFLNETFGVVDYAVLTDWLRDGFVITSY